MGMMSCFQFQRKEKFGPEDKSHSCENNTKKNNSLGQHDDEKNEGEEKEEVEE